MDPFAMKPAECYIATSTIKTIEVFTKEMEQHNIIKHFRGNKLLCLLAKKEEVCIDYDLCNCEIDASCFPLLVLFTDKHRYVVYPTPEERNKILHPKSALQDILLELRYNPEAGSRVSEARNDFNKRVNH
jgi:hypothetical protein